VRRELAPVADARLGPAGEHRRARGAAPAEGRVAEVEDIDAQRPADHGEEDVVGAALRAAGYAQTERVGPQGAGEVRDGVQARIRRHREHEGLAFEPRDRKGVEDGERALVGDGRAHLGQAADHQGVALPAQADDEARQRQGPAGAGPVFEPDAGDRAGLAQHLRDHLRRPVPAAAGRGGDEQP
jgi:hypothetical protein